MSDSNSEPGNGQEPPNSDWLLGEKILESIAWGAVLAPSDEILTGFNALISPTQRAQYDAIKGSLEFKKATTFQGDTEAEKNSQRIKDQARKELAAEKYKADFDALAGRSRSLTDFLAEADEGATYAIDQLLPMDGNATICAGMKVGKTTLTGNITRSFADGIPFLGKFEVAGPSIVGIWDYEMNPRQLRNWLRAHGIHNTQNVHILPLRGITPTMSAEEFQEWAVRWLTDRKIDVWILDTAHRAASGYATQGDPNDAVMAFTQDLDRIKASAGVRNVIMPIHTGLLGAHARGGARWGDWPDAIWTYVKDEGDKRTLSAIGRDVGLEEMPLNFDSETRTLSAPLFSGPAMTYKMTDVTKLVAWLRNHPERHPSKRTLALELNIGQDKAAAAVEQAESEGLIIIKRGPRGSHDTWLKTDWDAKEQADKEAAKPKQGTFDVQ